MKKSIIAIALVTIFILTSFNTIGSDVQKNIKESGELLDEENQYYNLAYIKLQPNSEVTMPNFDEFEHFISGSLLFNLLRNIFFDKTGIQPAYGFNPTIDMVKGSLSIKPIGGEEIILDTDPTEGRVCTFLFIGMLDSNPEPNPARINWKVYDRLQGLAIILSVHDSDN